MVWVTDAWHEPRATCTSPRVLPLLILEATLVALVLWRLAHQLYWHSHPRRVFFHVALLASCTMRWVFWFALCHVNTLYAVGIALLWWANSLLLLCTASIIVQWWCAVSVGRVAVRELQKVKRFSLQHPLVLLHVLHLVCVTVGGVFIIRDGASSGAEFQSALQKRKLFLQIYRGTNMTTVTIDAILALIVSQKLKRRLESAAMADGMKRKSVIQMTLMISAITIGLVVELAMDIPVVVSSFSSAFGSLRFSQYCMIKYFVPGVLLSCAFLYIMRRVEQRSPVRLVIMPTAASLVEYEECASPCMWCDHHRRYNVGQNKWDVNLMISISPRTVHSAAGMNHSHQHHLQHHNRNGFDDPILGGGNGTYPTELETPMSSWGVGIPEDFFMQTPSPVEPPPRTRSKRRTDNGTRSNPVRQPPRRPPRSNV